MRQFMASKDCVRSSKLINELQISISPANPSSEWELRIKGDNKVRQRDMK